MFLWAEFASSEVLSSAELTIAAVQLDGVGRQVDGNALVIGLRKFKILDLAVRAEYVHIQDCQTGDENTGDKVGEDRF